MIPRHYLPQIPAASHEEFCTFLQSHGVNVQIRRLPVSGLKAIQSEVNRDKIEHFKQNVHKLGIPIIVSKGGFILDGHHRWLAAKELDPNDKIVCIVCDTSIRELVQLGHEFDDSFVRTVYEAAIYRNIKTTRK